MDECVTGSTFEGATQFMKAEMNPCLSPLQPVFQHMPEYEQVLMTWNPYVVKNKMLLYQFKTPEDVTGSHQIISTGCVNFLFCCDPVAPAGTVSGVRLKNHDIDLRPNTIYFGFTPFTTKGVYYPKDSWEELSDQHAFLQEQYKENGIVERIAAAETFDIRIANAIQFARTTLIDNSYHPDFVEYTQMMICNTRGNLEIKQIYDYTGYTDRYCRKKFIEAFGVSMKTYASIMRFQNVIRSMNDSQQQAERETTRNEVMDAVFANGYYDQPHLIREFRRFANDTPACFNRSILQQVHA